MISLNLRRTIQNPPPAATLQTLISLGGRKQGALDSDLGLNPSAIHHWLGGPRHGLFSEPQLAVC